ncbi:MAG: hypothetical protein Q8R28_05910 [Dehalococcoidia bacterium]|nr:hypothetical protein [Dehalococcoidia bacterium]
MSQPELLKRVVQVLNQAGIPYMVSGSVVSSLQGEPRSTHDLDLVVALEKSAIGALVEAFPSPDFYLDADSIVEAIGNQGSFNLIDADSGDKVDFWMLTCEPFDRSRFGRRYLEEVLGIQVMVSSPEDTILAKLRWANLSGGSEKQTTDALRVYEVQFLKLDLDYLRGWADRLGIRDLLQRLEQEAEPI